MSDEKPPRIGAIAFAITWTVVSVLTEALGFWSRFVLYDRWSLMTAVAQTVLLGVVVRWRWWWLPATIAGALLAQYGVPAWLAMATPGLLPRSMPSILYAVALTFPQW